MSKIVVGVLVGLTFVPAVTLAQGRGRGNDDRRTIQGIPPGHMPPAGECRVWIDGRPAGQQPPPTDCRSAQVDASRTPYARVIYGDRRPGDGYRNEPYRRDDRRRGDRADDDYGRTGRAIPRDDRAPVYPDVYPQGRRTPDADRYPESRNQQHPGWTSGYRDGLVKGREDATRNRSYDPRRHQWYRSASRGYDRRYGLRGAYANVYRDGFEAGYAEEFRQRGRR